MSNRTCVCIHRVKALHTQIPYRTIVKRGGAFIKQQPHASHHLPQHHCHHFHPPLFPPLHPRAAQPHALLLSAPLRLLLISGFLHSIWPRAAGLREFISRNGRKGGKNARSSPPSPPPPMQNPPPIQIQPLSEVPIVLSPATRSASPPLHFPEMGDCTNRSSREDLSENLMIPLKPGPG